MGHVHKVATEVGAVYLAVSPHSWKHFEKLLHALW